MVGNTSAKMVDLIRSLSKKPITFDANYGDGTADLLKIVQGFMAKIAQYLIAKGNAGFPNYVDFQMHLDGRIDLMPDYACLARERVA